MSATWPRRGCFPNGDSAAAVWVNAAASVAAA